MSIVRSRHYQYLREEIEHIAPVSTHDHVRPERETLDWKIDLFDLVFASLVWVDMVSAGLPQLPGEPIGGEITLPKPHDYERLWKRLSPMLDHLRESAPFSNRMRALREIYGFDEELDDSNWRALNEKIMAAQKPGWYREILGKRENLAASLNDVPWLWSQNQPEDRFYSCNVMRVHEYTDLTQEFRQKGGVGGKPIETLQDAIDALEARIEEIVREGAIGLKMGHAYWRTLEFEQFAREAAEQQFPRPDHKGLTPKPVQDFMADQVCGLAADNNLPVAFHTGYQYGNGGNIRVARAQLLASIILRHPRTKFDVFHISYPYCEEAMMLSKYFPNAFFDFCFADYLSPSKIVQLLHIGIELLPSNKMFGWGADTGYVEPHYGSLCVTRDCIARALAERIENGDLSRKRAVRLMQKLMHDNAAEVYRVDEWRAAHPA
jgi:predicted TIM-barrel fold metal-dependent hydrolase